MNFTSLIYQKIFCHIKFIFIVINNYFVNVNNISMLLHLHILKYNLHFMHVNRSDSVLGSHWKFFSVRFFRLLFYIGRIRYGKSLT